MHNLTKLSLAAVAAGLLVPVQPPLANAEPTPHGKAYGTLFVLCDTDQGGQGHWRIMVSQDNSANNKNRFLLAATQGISPQEARAKYSASECARFSTAPKPTATATATKTPRPPATPKPKPVTVTPFPGGEAPGTMEDPTPSKTPSVTASPVRPSKSTKPLPSTSAPAQTAKPSERPTAPLSGIPAVTKVQIDQTTAWVWINNSWILVNTQIQGGTPAGQTYGLPATGA